MRKSIINKFCIVIAVMVTSLVVPTFGQITLENADFEAATLADGAWAGIPAGWMGDGANEQDLTASQLNPPAQSGENVCAFNRVP